ncbi:AAA family ATPase [Streptomyces sp. 71268]|uniref:AAA family ATPase n=1 Tax=Streptomyces sp. 71268 TaxID=3002640 RepID=UPI0023F6B013|nr:AAA family ATPase [Streptomyces sp. 71268]WEV23879.1 AAA family ATPase [Streptomyces sp. 71268]
MLVIVCGLPATGKTTLARTLARQIGAVHVRVDTIEQAIVRSGLAAHPVGPAGYAVAYALAEEHLRQGLTVIAESVSPLAVTRDAWRSVAERTATPVVEAEIVCSDPTEHRRRAEHRAVDIPDLPLPDWDAITHRPYEPWHREHLVLDTAGRDVAACVADLHQALSEARVPPATG